VVAEREGFDAMIIGCCYDPALTQAREITTIPIVGPLEAAVGLARPFGHRFAVVTDHHKAVPMIADLVRQYGAEPNCTSVKAIEWHISDMIEDPASVAADARARCTAVMNEEGAEAAVLGCTIIGACHELDVLAHGSEVDDSGIINPNVMALKVAEVLADLHRIGQYRISRRGYYEPFSHFDPGGAQQVLATIMDPTLPRP
jgi:allantoin racemase